MNTRPWWLKPLLLAALIGTAGYAVDQFGYQRAANLYTGKLATADAAHSRALLHLTEQRLTEQAAAQSRYLQLNAQAHAIGAELLQTRVTLATAQRQLTQRITHVTQNDGHAWTGLGPDSLQLYRAALGYTDAAADLPATNAGAAAIAGQTATASAGLPPVDLLHHAADYGQWCQQLESQLSAFIQLHREAAHD